MKEKQGRKEERETKWLLGERETVGERLRRGGEERWRDIRGGDGGGVSGAGDCSPLSPPLSICPRCVRRCVRRRQSLALSPSASSHSPPQPERPCYVSSVVVAAPILILHLSIFPSSPCLSIVVVPIVSWEITRSSHYSLYPVLSHGDGGDRFRGKTIDLWKG